MAKNNNPALGGTWEEYERELFTPEEIAESNRRVALISAEIEAREKGINTDEEVERFVAEFVEAQRLKGVELPEEYVEAMRRIVRKETTAEDETNKMLAKDWKELDNEFSILLDEEETRQFKEICTEAGETPESVLVKFAETVVRDKASHAILLAMVGAGEWAKYKYNPSPDERPRTLSPNGERCSAFAEDCSACDRCGYYYGCFPEESPEFVRKIIAGMTTPLSECVPESEVEW